MPRLTVCVSHLTFMLFGNVSLWRSVFLEVPNAAFITKPSQMEAVVQAGFWSPGCGTFTGEWLCEARVLHGGRVWP